MHLKRFRAAPVAMLAAVITLSWQDTSNPFGTTYNVYRAAGRCLVDTPPFARIAVGVGAKVYNDTANLLPGIYCYRVTAVYGGKESIPSNPARADIEPAQPTLTKPVITLGEDRQVF
jgi:hypothetical protein